MRKKLVIFLVISCGILFAVDVIQDEEVLKNNDVKNEEELPSICLNSDKQIILIKGTTDNVQKKAVKRNSECITNNDCTAKSISLICYKNKECLVRDIRSFKATPGNNEVIFNDCYSGMVDGSLSFHTPKKGCISVLNYTVHSNCRSRREIFDAAIGDTIFYFANDKNEILSGRLVNIFHDGAEDFACISSNEIMSIIALSQCLSVPEKNMRNNTSINLCFENSGDENLDIEMNYISKNIFWKPMCIIDIFEKFDRIDLLSQALLENNTGLDINNVDVVFSPSIDPLNQNDETANYHCNDETANYHCTVNVAKYSTQMCTLKSLKELKPTIKYESTIHSGMLETKEERNVDVTKSLLLKDVLQLGVDLNSEDGRIFVFRRIKNKRYFCEEGSIAHFKNENDLCFKVEKEQDIVTKIVQTDFKKIADNQLEYGVRIIVKNNKEIPIEMNVNLDINSSWKISKKNVNYIDAKRPTWDLNILPNEQKELHFRIRITK